MAWEHSTGLFLFYLLDRCLDLAGLGRNVGLAAFLEPEVAELTAVGDCLSSYQAPPQRFSQCYIRHADIRGEFFRSLGLQEIVIPAFQVIHPVIIFSAAPNNVSYLEISEPNVLVSFGPFSHSTNDKP